MHKTHYQAGLTGRRARRRGQGLVEMALIAPLMLVLAMGTLEVGLLLASHYNMLYATREAARIGAFARCSVDPVTGSGPDDSILRRLGAALKGKIEPENIGRVEIYKTDDTTEGNVLGGALNIYTNFQVRGFPGPSDPAILTPTGIFHSGSWDPGDRGDNPDPTATNPAPWLGVRVYYTHTAITFLGPLMATNGKFASSQRSVMRIEPPPSPLESCFPS